MYSFPIFIYKVVDLSWYAHVAITVMDVVRIIYLQFLFGFIYFWWNILPWLAIYARCNA
jgi:hypothetical protein